ncbi:MAG: LysM peptidoglycan-binding domain-containing protein [Deltaproteobacteria bacterium]|nr:LysM peptidoglycan-binding domain-containing protein [Deltaproteobacteria bacterium]
MKLPTPRFNRSKGPGQRNFRLTTLELLLAALIGLGGLYLLAVWVGLFTRGEPAAQNPGNLVGTGQQLERVMVANEKALARLTALEKENQTLKEQVASLTAGGAGGGKADPNLFKRLDALEAAVRELQAARGDRQNDGALAKKVDGMEAELNRLAASLRKVHAPVPDPELLGRLAALEEKAGRGAGEAPVDLSRKVEELSRTQRQILTRLSSLSPPYSGGDATAHAQPAPPPAPTAAPPEPPRRAPAAVAPPSTPPRQKTMIYEIRAGDTLYRIARTYRVTVEDLQRWNPKFQQRATLYIGEKVVIHPPN